MKQELMKKITELNDEMKKLESEGYDVLVLDISEYQLKQKSEKELKNILKILNDEQ